MGAVFGGSGVGAGAVAAATTEPFVGGKTGSPPIQSDPVAEISSVPIASSTSEEPKPNAAASFTTFSTTVASASGDAGGATPINSSLLAIKYPSSFRFPMINSAASRTPRLIDNAPNFHVKLSVRFV